MAHFKVIVEFDSKKKVLEFNRNDGLDVDELIKSCQASFGNDNLSLYWVSSKGMRQNIKKNEQLEKVFQDAQKYISFLLKESSGSGSHASPSPKKPASEYNRALPPKSSPKKSNLDNLKSSGGRSRPISYHAGMAGKSQQGLGGSPTYGRLSQALQDPEPKQSPNKNFGSSSASKYGAQPQKFQPKSSPKKPQQSSDDCLVMFDIEPSNSAKEQKMTIVAQPKNDHFEFVPKPGSEKNSVEVRAIGKKLEYKMLYVFVRDGRTCQMTNTQAIQLPFDIDPSLVQIDAPDDNGGCVIRIYFP